MRRTPRPVRGWIGGGTGPTRREALGLAAGAGLAWALAACGSDPRPGSTLARSLADPDGDGLLALGPPIALRDRTELTPASRPGVPIATLALLTDPHVRDAQSPARVPFLDRLGPKLGGAFRPHETLTAQVLAATVASIDDWGEAQAVLVTGDLVDSAQRNELEWALTLLTGGVVRPNSGGPAYAGVQEATNPDPLYYRPDVDAPRHPDLLRRALAPVRSRGLEAPWWPAIGNHDLLVQGELAPSAAITAVATGDRLMLAPSLDLARLARRGAIDRAQVDALLRAGVPGDAMRVAPDPRRAHLPATSAIERIRAAQPNAGWPSGPRLDYAVDVGDRLRAIVLDLARRDAGSDGRVTADTLSFLAAALANAGERHLLVACHQPLQRSDGGDAALALLDADPRVVAVLAGHTHRNEIEPRRTRAGGYWLVTTSSIVDYPQQWRALRLVETGAGGVALETWMVDHGGRPNDEENLAGIARDLAFLDPQGGRPAGAAGPATARNVRLHLPPRPLRPPRRPPTPQPLPPAPPRSTGGAGDAFG
jgi:3',5'-cyclic AMP phosphodiesterase CpdA